MFLCACCELAQLTLNQYFLHNHIIVLIIWIGLCIDKHIVGLFLAVVKDMVNLNGLLFLKQ